jgi:hypothetical protein
MLIYAEVFVFDTSFLALILLKLPVRTARAGVAIPSSFRALIKLFFQGLQM